MGRTGVLRGVVVIVIVMVEVLPSTSIITSAHRLLPSPNPHPSLLSPPPGHYSLLPPMPLFASKRLTDYASCAG